MKLNRTILKKTKVLACLILICSSIFAQKEEISKSKRNEIFVPQKLFQPSFSTGLQPVYSDFLFSGNYFTPTNKELLRLKQTNSFSRFSFKQNKTENNLPGLGSYDLFSNNLNYRISNKTKIDIGVGLARQNSILFAAKPNYQIGFKASVEFALTSKLDAFIYGQYFTSPINKPKDFFDPLIYRNPLFLQSEAGAGLKRNYKNVNAKFQINSIYDNNVRQFAPVNSKISIGF